jgi:hypothetical protein
MRDDFTDEDIHHYQAALEEALKAGPEGWKALVRSFPVSAEILHENDAMKLLGTELQSANTLIAGLREEKAGLEERLEALGGDESLLDQLTKARMEIAVQQRHYEELNDELRRRATPEQWLEMTNKIAHLTVERDQARAQAATLGKTLDDVDLSKVPPTQGQVAELEAKIAQMEQDAIFKARVIAGLRDQLSGGGRQGPRNAMQAAMASPPPVLPWTSIFETKDGSGQPRKLGLHYDANGNMTTIPVGPVRIERGAHDEVRLIVNDRLIRNGELWIDGHLMARSVEGP